MLKGKPMKKNRKSNKRKIYILLSTFHDRSSMVIRTFLNFNYSHASIGLEEDLNTFYSFVGKGFIVEKITRYAKPDREPFPCRMLELEVSEKVYNTIKCYLQTCVECKSDLHYTRVGVALTLMHAPSLPYRRRGHYHCSQFVAEVLENCKAAKLKRKCDRFRPSDFGSIEGIRLRYQGDMHDMVNVFHLSPA